MGRQCSLPWYATAIVSKDGFAHAAAQWRRSSALPIPEGVAAPTRTTPSVMRWDCVPDPVTGRASCPWIGSSRFTAPALYDGCWSPCRALATAGSSSHRAYDFSSGPGVTQISTFESFPDAGRKGNTR